MNLRVRKYKKKSVKNVNFVTKGGGVIAFSVVSKSTKVDIGVPKNHQTEREVSQIFSNSLCKIS